jgi:hypothetical protein
MVWSVVPEGPPAISVAHLVHRARLPSYRLATAEIEQAHPELRLTVTGPWAPYSFV